MNGRLVAIEKAGACNSAASTLTFRSTGFNGSLLAEGSVDPNWKMVSNPSNYGGSSGTDAIVTSSLTGGGTANAKYVNPVVGAGHVPEGAYVFRQMLDLSCHNPATAVIAGNVIADNHVQIFVNGIARSVILGPYDTVNSFSISGSGGGVFIAGWNVVDFVVTNTTGSVGNLSGMRVEVTSATATVNASASGAKFTVTRTPAGGNFTQGSTVSVSSGSENVTWSLEGSPGGTLTPNGNSATYTAPTPLTVMLVATIKATNGSGVVAYQPLWFNPGSGSGSVAISPTTPGNLAPYQTLSFSATVTGGTTNNVKWRVLSKTAVASSDGIFNTGTSCAASSTYRAPSTVTTAGNVTIEAESCDNASWKKTAVIPITVGSTVSMTPISPTPTVVTGSQQFNVTVTNADIPGVQWTTTPTSPVSISASGLFQLNGYTGPVTVTARSLDNTNVVSSHTFNQNANQSITLQSFSTTSRSATVGLSVQDVPLPGNYSKISWLDLIYSPTSGQNATPAGSTCRVRVTRTADPGGVFRIQVDDQNGGGNYTPFANFGSLDNVGSAGACRVAAAQTSGTASGGQWNLTIAFVGGGMSGMRYLRARSEPIAPSISSGWVELSGANWNVPAARVITMTNSKTNNPTIRSLVPAEALTLNMQSSAMYPGEVARIELVTANDGSIGYGTPSGSNVATATYTASNGGIARTIYFRAVIYENGTMQKVVDRMDGEYQVLVSTSADNPPTFQYYMPGSGAPSINPYPKDVTLSANGTSSQVIEFGVDNIIAASLTGAYRIQQFDFHINRTFGESYLAQDAAGGCRLRITTGSSTHTFQLADDQGQYTLPSVTFNPSTFTGGTLNNSQCTAEIVGPASFVYSPTYYQNYMFVGVKFYFKPPFVGTRRLFMKANRIQGDWTGWQPRSTYTMQ